MADVLQDRPPLAGTGDLARVRVTLQAACLGMLGAQWLVDASYANVASSLLAAASGVIAAGVALHPINRVRGNWFTAVILLFAGLSNSLLPMVATLAEGHSLAHNLTVPVQTYTHLLLQTLVLAGAHVFVSHPRMARPLSWGLKRRLFDPVGLTGQLPARVLLGMGAVGFLAMAAKLGLPLGETPIKKVLDGLGVFSLAPFILVLPPYACLSGRWRDKLLLGGYFVGMIFVAIMTNSRMVVIGPPATVVVGMGICLIAGSLQLDGRTVRRLILVALLCVPLSSIFNDISSALLIERAGREDRSASEQLRATWETFLDKPKIEAWLARSEREAAKRAGEAGTFRSTYIRNDYLSRFVTVKYHDDLLYRIGLCSDEDREQILQVSYYKTLALIPTPIARVLGIWIPKNQVNSFATGDMIYTLSGEPAMGKFLVGSVIAQAYFLFGPAYLILLWIITVFYFALLNGLGMRSVPDPGAGTERRFLLLGPSTAALFLAFKYCQVPNAASLDHLIGFLLRGLWQDLILFLVLSTAIGLLLRRAPLPAAALPA